MTDKRLIVSSIQDEASQNILSKLLESDWNECDRWNENPIYERGDDLIVTIDERHIYFDDIDRKIERYLGVEVDEVVYISKHSSEAGVDSLTVHPIGNYGEAKYGGKEGKLVPASPHSMTHALHILREKAEMEGIKNEYKISFEATHHGPFLETPTYYIEIGSDLDSWKDESAGKVIADTVLEVKDRSKTDEPVVICIGGGHYTPRFTDLAKSRRVALGHIVPGWGMRYLNKKSFSEAVEKTPEVDYIYFDRSSTSGKEREKVRSWTDKHCLEIIRSSDLEKR
ncbi:MAG: D-aminoacyl-tRNA deacylase [Candidatus Thermoplasmatota archaeon]